MHVPKLNNKNETKTFLKVICIYKRTFYEFLIHQCLNISADESTNNESFNLGVNRKHKLDSYRSTFAAATFKYFFIIFFYTFFIIIISLRVASRLVHNIWYEQTSHISNVILKYVTIRPPV